MRHAYADAVPTRTAVQNALLTRVDLETTFTSDGKVAYGLGGRSSVDLSEDGLWTADAVVGASLPSSAFASAWGRRHGSGGYATVSGARAAKRAAAGGRGGGAAAAAGGDGGLDLGSAAKALGKAVVPEGTVSVSHIMLGINVRPNVWGVWCCCVHGPCSHAGACDTRLAPCWAPLGMTLTAPRVCRVAVHAQGKQDVKVTLGYDIASKKPFVAVKENAWAARICSNSNVPSHALNNMWLARLRARRSRLS